MKNTLFLGGVLMFLMWATPTSAAVIYQNDFSAQPTLFTDDTNAYHWNEASGTLSMRLVQGPRTSINRYVALDTPLDPSRSFTLTWRQNMLVSSSTVQAPFGILPEGMVGASTTLGAHGGFIQPSIGIYQSRPSYQAFDVLTQDGRNDSGSGFGGFNFNAGGKWYQMTLAYDADVKRATYSVVDEVTGTTILLDARNGGTQGLIFGPEMHYIGSSMYAVAKSGTPTALVTAEYYADVLIDDIRLEQEVITPPEVATLTEPESAPSLGVPGTSFAWRAVYTHPDNHAPQTARVIVGSTTYDLMKATNATSTLGDGDYQNGEEYTFTLPLHARGATEAQFLFMTESGTLATSAPSVRVGYSNVAFLPGIQSSFLYREGVVGDNQLWLPNIGVGTDGDLEDLFMDADGTSVRSDIYTRDAGIIEKAYGFRDVYEGFPVYMNSLVADDTIAAWKPIAYDWRLSFDELLTHGAVDGGGKIDYNQDGTYILDQLRTLASTSDNGRVTIVAHSHGGLLTKAVLKKLEEAGDPLLQKIDTVIFVGVPHLGTPKALLPTLHGAENALSTLSLDDATWRAAAKNSPGALMLLPSREYHEAAESTALVTFDDSLNALQETIRLRDELSYTGEGLEAVVDYRIRYGNDIRSYDEMQEFLEGVGRTAPLYADVLHPENLAPTLLGDAEAAHAALDAWSPQDVNGDGVPDIRVVNVVGTGLATIKGVSYITAPHLFACAPECSLRVPVRAVQAVPEFSSRGDGTVMVESADYGQGDTVYFDISNYNLTRELVGDSVERDHSNVMGAQPIRNLISATLRDDATPSPYLENVLPASRAVTVVEMHSPVAMEVRDATGNRVGAIYNAELGTTTFEATIPNSTYERVGQSTFIVVPTGPAYTVKLDGMASGTFTMKVKNYEADQLVASTTFTAVPTTAALLGSAILGTTTAPTVLQLDTNGDGVTDVVRKPDGTQSETALTAIKDFKTLLGTTAMSKRLKGTLSLLTFTTEQLIVARKYNLARISIGVMKQVIEKGVKTNDISRANADILTVQLNKVMLLLK